MSSGVVVGFMGVLKWLGFHALRNAAILRAISGKNASNASLVLGFMIAYISLGSVRMMPVFGKIVQAVK
jgi:hypothetical protein